MKMLQWPETIEKGRLWAVPCAGCDMVFWFDASEVHELMLKYGLRALSLLSHESKGECRTVMVSSEEEDQMCVTMYCPTCEKELDERVLASGGVVENEEEQLYFGDPGEA